MADRDVRSATFVVVARLPAVRSMPVAQGVSLIAPAILFRLDVPAIVGRRVRGRSESGASNERGKSENSDECFHGSSRCCGLSSGGCASAEAGRPAPRIWRVPLMMPPGREVRHSRQYLHQHPQV